MVRGHKVAGRLAQMVPLDDVGGLRVQLPNRLMAEPLRKALELGELVARLHDNQDAEQAQQQVAWEGRHAHNQPDQSTSHWSVHKQQTHTGRTCDGEPVQVRVRVVLSAVSLSRDVVPQAHGRQRYEAEVQRLQEAPVFLQVGEDTGRNEDEEQQEDQRQTGGVHGGQRGLAHGPAEVEVGQGTAAHQDHEPLHRHGEEEERDGDAQDAEEDAEGLASVRQRNCVTVA